MGAGSDNSTLLQSFLEYEQSFDPMTATLWMQRNWHHSLTICIIYLILIFGGQYLMRNVTSFDLRKPLILWNLFLSIFSFIGAFRTVPDLYSSVVDHSFMYSICDKGRSYWGGSGLWATLFVFSKPVELIDTAFVVLRKRPLIFLHWYHHVTVFVYTWHASKDHTASGRWFVTMNLVVHAVMYLYYAMRACGQKFPRIIPMMVTLLQLSQMFVGCYVTVNVYNIRKSGQPCQQSDTSVYFALLIYASYFALFAQFFKDAYFSKAGKHTKLATPQSNKQQQNGDVSSNKQQNGDLKSNKQHNGVILNGVHKNGYIDIKKRASRRAD